MEISRNISEKDKRARRRTFEPTHVEEIDFLNFINSATDIYENLTPEEEVELPKHISRGMLAEKFSQEIIDSEDENLASPLCLYLNQVYEEGQAILDSLPTKTTNADKKIINEVTPLVTGAHEWLCDFPNFITQADLQLLIEHGILARNEMLLANLGQCISIARTYDTSNLILENSDLFGEIVLGCLYAAQIYDHERGTKFITVATSWMKKAASTTVYEAKPGYTFDPHTGAIIQRILNARTGIAQEKRIDDSEVGLEEVAQHLGMTTHQVELKLENHRVIKSLSSPVNDQDSSDSELGDMIEDESQESPEDITQKNNFTENMERILSLIPSIDGNKLRAQKKELVARMRFGIHPYDREYDHEEIAEILGIKKSHSRHLIAQLLADLRALPEARELAQDFLGIEL